MAKSQSYISIILSRHSCSTPPGYKMCVAHPAGPKMCVANTGAQAGVREVEF